jgi:hypothetical protein
MNKNRWIQVLLTIGIASSMAMAEMRVWTAQSGKTVEAEFVRTTGDKVVLRKTDGSEIKVPLDALSEKDRRYAVLQAPPRIEISVAADVDRSNKTGGSNRGSGLQLQQETIVAKVKVEKASPAPYVAPLEAEVYLIGHVEQTDNYIILDHTKSGFSFSGENANEHAFESMEVNLRQLESGQQMGVEYRGYLAVVQDKAGNILEIKTNKLDFQRNADAIMGSKRGDAFDENFNPVNRKESREQEKPRRRPFPGRRF